MIQYGKYLVKIFYIFIIRAKNISDLIGLEKQNKSHIFIIVLEYNMRPCSPMRAW